MNTPNNIELRDWFAGMALQGMLANGSTCDDVKLAGYSFGVADAMLAARKGGA